jgi:hypothetical protein
MKISLSVSILCALKLSYLDAAQTRYLKKKKSTKSSKHGGAVCLADIPIDTEEDFGEPDWLKIIEGAFPPWKIDGDCASLKEVGGESDVPFPEVDGSQVGKFNPCYYTKRFAGLSPLLGGYPTPIDTHYPYEFAAPFFSQPGGGSVHHCSIFHHPDNFNIASCPKLGAECGPDCAIITDDYGIGHIPPFVALSAVRNGYESCKYDICNDWFDFETNGCNIKKDILDELVYNEFGDEDKIKFPPPILINGEPSSTYFKLEYGGDASAGPNSVSFGPHYCTKKVAVEGKAWGDFCPYIHTGKNSGKYRHPHLGLAAFELWIANQCMPQTCPLTWLDSPNGKDYATDSMKASNIAWCQMENNDDPMSQPESPYMWPNEDEYNLFDYASPFKQVKGVFVTDLVARETERYSEDYDY